MRRAVIRGALYALVTAAAMFGATGCTPAKENVAAIRLEQGRPVVVLGSCSKSDEIQVYTTPRPDGSRESEWSILRNGGGEPKTVTVFGPPPEGWKVQSDTLTALEKGTPYHLVVSRNERAALIVEFTPEDLEGLRNGDVLAADKNGNSRAMSERDFRDLADDSC
jgi:hypothetical protein